MQSAVSNEEINEVLNAENKKCVYEDVLQRCGISQAIKVCLQCS